MKSFIFVTNEGYTYQPNSESQEPDIENSQVMGYGDGIDAQAAFKNLLKENEYIKDTSFNEIIAFELKKTPTTLFCLNDCKKLNAER